MFDPCAHVAGHGAQVLQNEFGRFCFAGSTLARYHTRLVDVAGLQTIVSRFRDGENVRFQDADFRSVILEHVILYGLRKKQHLLDNRVEHITEIIYNYPSTKFNFEQ